VGKRTAQWSGFSRGGASGADIGAPSARYFARWGEDALVRAINDGVILSEASAADADAESKEPALSESKGPYPYEVTHALALVIPARFSGRKTLAPGVSPGYETTQIPTSTLPKAGAQPHAAERHKRIALRHRDSSAAQLVRRGFVASYRQPRESSSDDWISSPLLVTSVTASL
jgi:hypothetical protein